MLITPKRKFNKFGHLIEFIDNGFVGHGMGGKLKKFLQKQVANKILDDVKTRLDPAHKKHCEERFIEGKDFQGNLTGLMRFSAVENMDAFLRGVKSEKIPLLLTITKTEIFSNQIKFIGIDNILFYNNGEEFSVVKDVSQNLPCIQIAAVFQRSHAEKGDFEEHINNISKNLEYYLAKASFEISLANQEVIPEFLAVKTISQAILKNLAGTEPKEVRMINDEKYNTETVPFTINHVRCTNFNHALERSKITTNNSELDLALTRVDEKQTTDSYQIFKKIPKIKLEFKL